MILYYTGAVAYDLPQPEPDKSLGGYQSNSVVPNGRMNNLFPDDTYKDKNQGSIINRALVIVNNSNNNVTDLSVAIDNPVISQFKIEIALVTLVSPNFQVMEQIQNDDDQPYTGTFIEVNVDTPLSIGSIAANAKLGIWIRKTLKAGISLSCSDIANTDMSSIIKKGFNLTLSW
jgi:hypothetical protein